MNNISVLMDALTSPPAALPLCVVRAPAPTIQKVPKVPFLKINNKPQAVLTAGQTKPPRHKCYVTFMKPSAKLLLPTSAL